jgi:hypothetical protein
VRRFFLLLLLPTFLATFACSKPAPPPAADDDDGPSEEEREKRDDKRLGREVSQWIKDAQARAFGGDSESYFKIYAADGQMVTARSETPGPYDIAVPTARLREWYAVRGKLPASKDHKAIYADEKIAIDGDTATVSWHVSTSWREESGSYQEEFTERYRLARGEDRWQVKEKRIVYLSATGPSAPQIEGGPPGPPVTVAYDAAYWEARDRDVETAKASSERLVVLALFDANRLTEAHQLATSYARTGLGTAEAWFLLGQAAMRLAYVTEAKEAFAKAARLDSAWAAPPPFGPGKDEPRKGGLRDLLRSVGGPAL